MSDGTLTEPPASGSGLPSRQAVVLVVDLIESVILMERHEEQAIGAWQAFVEQVQSLILPSTSGRLVKSLGDGLMAEFSKATDALAAARAMHEWMATAVPAFPDGSRMALRAGLHATRVFDAKIDIYGAGVNLAARVASLASAGETVATVEARDLMVDPLDTVVEDLGDCHLKHIERPVRVYRLGQAEEAISLPSMSSYATPLSAAIAVIPFSDRPDAARRRGIGDMIADGLISQLAQTSDLQVVSRLSSMGFKDRDAPLEEIARRLNVRFVVSGSYSISGRKVSISAELADARAGCVLWSGRALGDWRDLFQVDNPLTHELADAVHRQILEAAVSGANTRPLPTLSSYELFLAGITMMHRANAVEFEASRRLLESLTERHRRVALPFAWLGKWHVLHSIQGQVDDTQREAAMALQRTGHALDLEPSSSLALAIEGFVYCHLKKDLDTAELRLREACELNPSEGFAWLFLSVTQAFKGDSASALECARRAMALSPLDPLRYYYESLLGSCEFSAGHLEEAIRWCESARRRNRQHLSTLRILIAAYVELGKKAQAAALAVDLLRLRPGYTVAAYQAHSVAALYPFGVRVAQAMKAAGIP